jgi:hypothetical protein
MAWESVPINLQKVGTSNRKENISCLLLYLFFVSFVSTTHADINVIYLCYNRF